MNFSRNGIRPAAWAFLAVLCLAVSPDRAIGQNTQIQRPTSTPYSGDLSIFETKGREERLQIQRVMDLLKIKQGSGVADLGAGSGWFTVRAAARVGATGTVFAEDINPEAIKYIDQRIQKEKLGNVRTVLGTPDDPKLPPQSVDAVMLLKVYHEIAQPLVLLARLKPSLRPGARVGIIDRNGNGSDHGLNGDVVKREMKAAGFKLTASYDFTKADGQDYFLIFQAQ
jgi:ubiquinone/menaquinone biosynthesis C-methylase UbiE